MLLTGSVAEPVDEKLAREAGADGMIHKPFESKALLSLVGPLSVKAAELRDLRPAGPPPPPPGEEPKFVSGAVAAEPEPEFAVDPEADAAPVSPKPVPVAAKPAAAPQLAPLGVKSTPESEPDPIPSQPAPATVSEVERVRAAVTLALDAAMPRLIDELTQQVLRALDSK